MKIHFLGTNGWYTTPTGNTPCILIDSKDNYVIFDAGNGIYKVDEYIKEDKPISLFISHFHIDHVSGLHTLMKFNFKQGLNVYVGKNRAKDFETLVNPPFTIGYKKRPDNVSNLRYEVRLHELDNIKNDQFKASAIKQHHAYVGHGYRIELEGKTIAYTGDCKRTEASIPLAKGADLLICECSNIKSPEDDKWGHFDPTQAANFAKDANVKQLILTHFAAHLYTKLSQRNEAEKEAKKIFPNARAATDGLTIEL